MFKLKSLDYTLIAVVILLSVIGVFMIYATTNAPSIPGFVRRIYGDRWVRQLIHILSGLFVLLFFSLIDLKWIGKYYLYIYGLMILLLIATLVIGVDDATQTARWIRIPMPFGIRLSMQPSEFSKIFIIIFLAKFLEVKKDVFNKPRYLLLLISLILLPVILVQIQPSLSASLVILFIALVIVFMAGIKRRTILIIFAFIFPLLVLLLLDINRSEPRFITFFLADYQWERIYATLINPQLSTDAFLQTEGSLRAIRNGGLFGTGFLNNSYVILGFNDFVFSAVAEQFGFIGGLFTLGLIGFIIVKCLKAARHAESTFEKLIASGVAGMLIFEAFVNTGVALAILPNTGMPFPFVSYGGSMIWSHMMAVGFVINISQKGEKHEYCINST